MDMSAIQLLPTVLEHESTTEGSTPPVVDTRQPPSQPSPSQPPPSLAVTLSSSAVDADTNLGTEEACSNHLNHRQDSDSSWTHTRGPSDIDNLESVTILLEEGLDKMARERNSAYFPSSHSQSASAISANRFQTLQ